MKPTDEEIARDYELWIKYVHDEIPGGEFNKMTVREKLEIIAATRHMRGGNLITPYCSELFLIALFRNLATVSKKLSRVRLPSRI